MMIVIKVEVLSKRIKIVKNRISNLYGTVGIFIRYRKNFCRICENKVEKNLGSRFYGRVFEFLCFILGV